MQAVQRPAFFPHPFAGGPPLRVLFVSSYPPRECGIATFTEDIRTAYDSVTKTSSDVIAVTDDGRSYAYPSCVGAEIVRSERSSYAAAARFANEHPCDVVNIQHEYGLFGGPDGEFVLDFMADLRKPVVLTLHTTLPDPDDHLRYVTRELCNRSDRVVVLAYAGRRILEECYGIDTRKIDVILHGVPDVPFRRSHHFKRQLGLEHHTVLSTFGLLSRGKGIEYVLEALPAIVAQNPQTVYLLWGETHPEVRKLEGESYRESLWRRVRELGLERRVRFMNHYMNDDEVVRSLLATDVYVSPALDPNQIVSGTLSYAVACGRVVVATGSLYAQELLADGRGIVIPFKNAQALAAAVNVVLADPALRSSIETAAYRYGRGMTWPRVARYYVQTFREAAARSAQRRAVAAPMAPAEAPQRTGGGLGGLREALTQRAPSFPAVVSESLTRNL